jgi:hypothetical protein
MPDLTFSTLPKLPTAVGEWTITQKGGGFIDTKKRLIGGWQVQRALACTAAEWNQHRRLGSKQLYLPSPLGRFAKVERRKGGVEAQCLCPPSALSHAVRSSDVRVVLRRSVYSRARPGLLPSPWPFQPRSSDVRVVLRRSVFASARPPPSPGPCHFLQGRMWFISEMLLGTVFLCFLGVQALFGSVELMESSVRGFPPAGFPYN